MAPEQQAFEQTVVELNTAITEAFNAGDVTAAYSGEGEHPYWLMVNTTTA